MHTVSLLLCAALLAAVADAQEAVASWPGLRAETSARYRTTSRISHEVPAGAEPWRQEFTVHTEETHTVTAVDGAGVAVLRIERTRIWGTMQGGAIRKPVTFDTAGEGPVHPVAKGLVDVFRPPIVLRIDRSGKVMSARRVGDDGQLEDQDDHERDTLQFGFVHVPELPIAVGATWRPARGVHECEATGGCVELATRNELTAADEDALTVKTVAADVADGDAEPREAKHRVERTIRLSRRDGLTVAMRATGTTRDDGAKRDVEIEMQRVPDAGGDGAAERPGR
jgi:hypothetical protein